MFKDSILLLACGMAGAMTYSFPSYLKAISKKPPMEYALVKLGFALFVGSVCALLFTRTIGYRWSWTIQPEPWPLAMVIGLGSNPLVPIILRRLEKWADSFGVE